MADLGKNVDRVWGLGGVLLSAVAWEAAVSAVDNPALLPGFLHIGRALVEWAGSGLLASDIAASLPRALLAIGLAAPIGVIIGLIVGLSRRVRLSCEWAIHFMRSLPPVALLPLFILWFGIEWWSKLAATVFVCVFPVAVTTTQAVTYAQRQFEELARDLQLDARTYVARVILPASLPAITPGLRLSSGTAFVMLYVSELAGASEGLGYRISISQLAYRADLMIAGLFVLGLVAWFTDWAIDDISKRYLHYAGK